MTWESLDTKTKSRGRSENPEYDDAARECSPVLHKEESQGPKTFGAIQFQPVVSYGLFEGEFAIKGPDLIFHFWPYKHAEGKGKTFPKGFPEKLIAAMTDSFGPSRFDAVEDRELGSWFVRAIGFGEHDFAQSRAVGAVRQLHKSLGGAEG